MYDKIRKAVELLKGSIHAIAFTGAGISTESNIPDFRGNQGLWRKFDPKMASKSYFKEDPDGFWNFYAQRYEAIAKAVPNEGHRVLAKLEEIGLLKYIVTQNIDRLHIKGGSKSVIELHGNILMSHCESCFSEKFTDECIEEFKKNGKAPRCKYCGDYMRPSVVLFEEPVRLIDLAMEIACRSDYCIVIGSSLVVYPAALIPEIVKRQGGRLVIVNLEPTPLDCIADVVINERASVVLKKILEFL
ncbi:MAG: NAD-dependent deacylase [Candidatus Methanomethyliaceae archaeon]|nr:NAD-dependent deacylase [Candidatus Methanomethyliaceae archaeon]MDW7970685.1 NAD-dependent deacylase [Nitrososphaerota archaeon]